MYLKKLNPPPYLEARSEVNGADSPTATCGARQNQVLGNWGVKP